MSPIECEHGSLARSCSICDLERELKHVTEQRDKLLAALDGLSQDIHSLIHESSGVSGLHLNDDLAPWHELEAGGRFERLIHLPIAFETIAEVRGAN